MVMHIESAEWAVGPFPIGFGPKKSVVYPASTLFFPSKNPWISLGIPGNPVPDFKKTRSPPSLNHTFSKIPRNTSKYREIPYLTPKNALFYPASIILFQNTWKSRQIPQNTVPDPKKEIVNFGRPPSIF
jgi:hypothetical protein